MSTPDRSALRLARGVSRLAVVSLFAATAFAQSTPSSQTIRLGSPPNPAAFQPGTSTGPVIGKVWDPILIPAGVVQYTVIVINPSLGAMINVPSPAGTLLCAFPPQPAFYVFGFAYQIYAIPIPNLPSLVGLRFCAQGVGIKPNGNPEFYNALDCAIGDA